MLLPQPRPLGTGAPGLAAGVGAIPRGYMAPPATMVQSAESRPAHLHPVPPRGAAPGAHPQAGLPAAGPLLGAGSSATRLAPASTISRPGALAGLCIHITGWGCDAQ